MSSLTRRTVLAGLALGALVPVSVSARSLTPPRGSALRKAVLDALRPRVEREIGAPVEFLVSLIHVDGPWAFVSVTPQRPGGRPIDWSRTRYADAWKNDWMSDVIQALLWHSGGRWRVREFAFGPTDVPWIPWPQKYGLPVSFFEYP